MPTAPSHALNLPSLSSRRILRTWWPLAASWLLMGAEGPLIFSVIARLANPEINLAAYNGLVYPLALIVESPIIMLLAASTALSKDWASYRKLYRFMMVAGGALTLLHVLVAFTPLYYFVVQTLMGAAEEIVEPARIGLMILTPWTWSIAYRRFQQGVLIRFDRSKAVGLGTMIRLIANALVLFSGYLLHTLPGIVVGSCAVAAGVISEAVYAGWVVRPVLRSELRVAPPVKEPITLPTFLRFYIPLVFTSLLGLLFQPIGSAAMNRMPDPIPSLAVWGVVASLIFMFRSAGVAYNEVVVALLDEPGSLRSLRRFTAWMSAAVAVLLLLMIATPLSNLYFSAVQGLNPELARLAVLSVWIALPIPSLNVYQSWYQGSILHSRHTRAITESVVVFLACAVLVLGAGMIWGRVPGIYIGVLAFSIAMVAQTIWLWYRGRNALEAVQERDTQPAKVSANAGSD